MGVIDVIEKKGILVKSQSAANTYIKEFKAKDHILSMREAITRMIEEKRSIEDAVLQQLDSVIEEAVLLKSIGIITPLNVKIGDASHLIGKTIGEVRFWEYTGATIIGINRMGQLFLSPGPKLVFYPGDVILYVGNEPSDTDRVIKYVDKQ